MWGLPLIKLQTPTKLLPAFDNLSCAIYDTIVLYGGRGGAKSQALANLGILESYIDNGVILCCREVQRSINDSIYSMLVSAIERLKLLADFEIFKHEITNKKTGAKFIFAGLKHNVTAIKSIDRLRVVLVDEAENVSQDSWDILLPTPRYGNTRIYVVFNPRFESDPTYKLFVQNPHPKKLVININWADNPWFPKSLDNVRQRDLRGDMGRYAWIWEGKFLTIADSSILAKKITCFEFELDASFGEPLIGIDWGFSNDPTAVVECYVKDNNLYIYNANAKVGLELDDTADWLLKSVPNLAYHTSRADNARPETISKVKKDGIPLIRACLKYKGSLEDGIVYLQGFKQIVIHPQADACRAELMAYSFKKDRFDEITAVPLDKDNHFADCLRYACEPLIKNRSSVFDFIE